MKMLLTEIADFLGFYLLKKLLERGAELLFSLFVGAFIVKSIIKK